MTVLITNNASSILAAGISSVATTITLRAGDGALYPSPGVGEWFPVTLVDLALNMEIARCTSRTVDTLTVVRGQEGTTARAWLTNDRIDLRITAACWAELVQINSGFRTGMRIGHCGASAPSGWVLGSGKTIGSAASGGTERANQDTYALYTLLWTDYSNAVLPIQDSAGSGTTRGASADADFYANKRLPVPDYRGRGGIGDDDMGGTAANRVTTAGSGIDGATLGASGGSQTTVVAGSGGSTARLNPPPAIVETIIIKL